MTIEIRASAVPSWGDCAARVCYCKFGDVAPADYKERVKQARFLQQRGFTTEHIESLGD